MSQVTYPADSYRRKGRGRLGTGRLYITGNTVLTRVIELYRRPGTVGCGEVSAVAVGGTVWGRIAVTEAGSGAAVIVDYYIGNNEKKRKSHSINVSTKHWTQLVKQLIEAISHSSQ